MLLENKQRVAVKAIRNQSVTVPWLGAKTGCSLSINEAGLIIFLQTSVVKTGLARTFKHDVGTDFSSIDKAILYLKVIKLRSKADCFTLLRQFGLSPECSRSRSLPSPKQFLVLHLTYP